MQISNLNSYYEYYEFYTAWRYAATYYNICLALFYSSICPISVLYCFLSTFIKYFSDKYILIKRSNSKVGYSEKMSFKITSELRFFLFYYISGIIFKDILISFYKYGEIKLGYINYIWLIISILFIFTPFKKLGSIIKNKIIYKNKNYYEINRHIQKGYKTKNKYNNLINEIGKELKNRNIFD